MRILFLGDIVGAPGLKAVQALLPALAAAEAPDLVVANGENAAGGLGITAELVADFARAGVQVVTTGNHVWDKKEILGRMKDLPFLLRPANYPPTVPGRGWCVADTPKGPVGVMNLSGRIFMDPLDCPFRGAEAVLEKLAPRARVILVDFHAEATSEKRALGFFLDGRVTAVVGTHTHVPTADAQVLPGGTGYMTDVGMTGAVDSVIGVPPENALRRFLSQIPASLGVAKGEGSLNGVVVDADPSSGRCLAIRRVEARPAGAPHRPQGHDPVERAAEN
ncbi:MAG: TIGR00282 family metallophosphoesterase [Deltaproteobacteria bacterium]|nr:TIGR00282 family metallophosphoesterase [Deltaproteobacteria bacterium]